MRRLTSQEFRGALQKGLGRAVLHLKEFGAGEYQHEILNACLHNQVYDTQCEDGRADWLMSIIGIAGNAEFYRDHVLAHLEHSTAERDVYQLVSLAAAFARLGYAEARRAIYAKFDRQQFGESWVGADEIVALNGIEGMLHVSGVIGAYLHSHPQAWANVPLLTEVCEKCGQEPTMAALREQAQFDVNLSAYLQAAEVYNRPSGECGTARPLDTIDSILSAIETARKDYRGRYMSFGWHADPADLERVFARLLTESRREQLLHCLWVFRRRAAPRLDCRFFDLASSDDEELRQSALAVLAQMQDSSIRELGLSLLREQSGSIEDRIISLFAHNYLPGDHEVIERALSRMTDGESIHGIGFEIAEVARTQPHPELAKCLEWVYEQTPCTNCRYNAVKELIARGRATDALLNECLWDCSEEICTLARNETGSAAPNRIAE